MLRGQCHCGAIAFEIHEVPAVSTICNCRDCRRQSGAPITAWAMTPRGALHVRGEPKVYSSSDRGRRSFCANCGTGLFFTNAILDQMGFVQVRVAALDEPDAIEPKMQVQTAERIGWMETAHTLPAFERFPGRAS